MKTAQRRALEQKARENITAWAGRVGELAVIYAESTANHFSKDTLHNIGRLRDLDLTADDIKAVEWTWELTASGIINKDLVQLYFDHANTKL